MFIKSCKFLRRFTVPRMQRLYFCATYIRLDWRTCQSFLYLLRACSGKATFHWRESHIGRRSARDKGLIL